MKMVNLLPEKVNVKVIPGNLVLAGKDAVKTVLTGKPDDKNAKPQTSAFLISDMFTCELPAYSFTVIRVKERR